MRECVLREVYVSYESVTCVIFLGIAVNTTTVWQKLSSILHILPIQL